MSSDTKLDLEQRVAALLSVASRAAPLIDFVRPNQLDRRPLGHWTNIYGYRAIALLFLEGEDLDVPMTRAIGISSHGTLVLLTVRRYYYNSYGPSYHEKSRETKTLTLEELVELLEEEPSHFASLSSSLARLIQANATVHRGRGEQLVQDAKVAKSLSEY